MNQSDITPPAMPERPRRSGLLFKAGWIMQCCVFAFLALMTIVVAFDFGKTGVPGAPLLLLYLTLATFLAMALLHLPPIFIRLPNKLRWGAYGFLIPSLVLFGAYAERMNAAYVRTPEGAKQAAARAVQEREEQRARDKAQAEAEVTSTAEAKVQANLARLGQVIEQRKKLDACFSFVGHRLPDLERQVRESLNNPDAFKHVRTESIDPDGDGNNIEMTFRAQNGFSAIITTNVRAHINPDTCAVESVGQTAT